MARRAHVGHDRVQRRRGSAACSTTPTSRAPTSTTRGTRSSRRSGAHPTRPASFENRELDAHQLPAVEPARGQLPRPRRPVHRRRADEGPPTAEPGLPRPATSRRPTVRPRSPCRVGRAAGPHPRRERNGLDDRPGGEPGREPDRDRDDLERGTSASVATIVTPNPTSAASERQVVLWVAYRPRARRWPSASNGTASANATSTVDVSRTSSASNAPPPSRTSIAVGPTTAEGERGDHGRRPRSSIAARPHEARESGPIARRPGGRQGREGGHRDRDAEEGHGDALEVAGEAHGRDAARGERRRDAREEQERERLDRVAQHLGHHEPQELVQRGASGGRAGTGPGPTCAASRRAGCRGGGHAPTTAPSAAAAMPSRSWNRMVPAAMPTLYRIGARA